MLITSKKKRVPVVFGIEKEICTDNCYTYGYNDQYEEHEQHKTVDIVNLIGPKWRENKVPENWEN